jgi:ribosomal protein L11 methyltransferase
MSGPGAAPPPDPSAGGPDMAPPPDASGRGLTRRVALTLRADAVEAVLDGLMPRLPQGVYERDLGEGLAEVAFYGAEPSGEELDAIAGAALVARDEEQVPDSREERRRRAGRAWEVAGRLRVRAPSDAPSADADLEVVVEPAPGAFGTGAHPTTRMCLELLLELEPDGGLADLGCGSGVVAIAAARLGWDPVIALDYDQRAVDATWRNAQRNDAEVRPLLADLREVPPPPARTLAGNVPLDIHERVAAALAADTERVVATGITASQAPAAEVFYAAAGLAVEARRVAGGWAALRLGRA